MALDPHEKLLLDHQKARDHIDRYKTAVTNGFMARIAILNGAIQNFNTWRDMKDAPNSALAILEAAFAVVSTLVPALKLGAIVKKHHEAASAALSSARAFGRAAKTADKAIRIGTGLAIKGGEAADKAAKIIKDGKDMVDKIKAAMPEIKDETLHASRGPIQQLVKDIYEAPKTWEDAIAAETQEWENRMSDSPAMKFGGTLEDKMKELLPLPEVLNVEEITNLYLFELIGAHIRQECHWLEIVHHSYGYTRVEPKETMLQGLNGTQMKKIMEWYGPGTIRGTYFKRPPVIHIAHFIGLVEPIPRKQKHRHPISRVA